MAADAVKTTWVREPWSGARSCMRNAAHFSVIGCRTSRIIWDSRGGGFGRSNTASAASRYGQASQVLESGDSMVRIVIGIILFSSAWARSCRPSPVLMAG